MQSDSEELEITDYPAPNQIGNQTPMREYATPGTPHKITATAQRGFPGVAKVMARDITTHVKSKNDLHFILSIEGRYNIPSIDNCSMFFMKEVLAGRKKVIKLADVRPIICPRLKDFSADKLFELSMADEVLS